MVCVPRRQQKHAGPTPTNDQREIRISHSAPSLRREQANIQAVMQFPGKSYSGSDFGGTAIAAKAIG